jgi:hypothetical protein
MAIKTAGTKLVLEGWQQYVAGLNAAAAAQVKFNQVLMQSAGVRGGSAVGQVAQMQQAAPQLQA